MIGRILCRIGLHKWRTDTPISNDASLFPDEIYVFSKCQRCKKEHVDIYPMM